MAEKAVGVKEASIKGWRVSFEHIKTLFQKPLRQVSHFGLVAVILVVLLSGVPTPKSIKKLAEVPVDPFGMVRSTMAPEGEIDLTELEILAMMTSYIDTDIANDVYMQISSNESEAKMILAGNTIANAAIIDTESSAAIKNKFIDYVVQGGDTLSVIASKFSVTTNSIKWSNAGIADINSIKPGTALKIPTVTGIVYTVKKGDSVELIASNYKSNATQIIAYNDLYGESLAAGMTILIPNGTVTEVAPTPKTTVAASSGTTGRLGSSSYIASTGRLKFPTIIGRNGYYNGYHWWAIDVPNSIGTPIYAADSGRIVEAAYGWNGGFGNTILVDHGNGMQTRYAHMSTLLIRGGYVSKGQTIGLMGSTGRSTGSHLHFEVIVNGSKINPNRYF
jgi:murein DD-endopeptidase MepM/ murein hydrolase activator NlpD